MAHATSSPKDAAPPSTTIIPPPPPPPTRHRQHDRPSVATKSAGVRRIEDLAAVLTTWDRVFIFLGVFLVAFAYGLDGTLRYAYQPVATASFSQHSLLATVNVLRSVIAAAAQPTSAKIADLFGRVELVCLSVGFYVLGTVVEAGARGVSGFAAGALIYQVGYTMVMLLVEVIVADITSTRARVFFSYVPAMPFLVTTWVSGNVAQAVLAATTWRWGIGMWAVIYPVCALPLVVSLTLVGRRARRQQQQQQQTGEGEGEAKPPRQPWLPFLTDLFWRLDVVGIVLLVAIFALLLVPLTLAGGFHASWSAPRVIVPLVVGACAIPCFVLCQLRARHPLVPLRRMRGRAVWCPLAIALLLNWAWYMQGDYLFSVLVVAFDFDTMTATRVASFYSFFGVLSGSLLGLVVYKVRRLKVFIVAGTCLFAIAFGLLIHFRGSPGTSDRAGVIGAQIVLGIAGGMFPYPAQASLQAALKHEHLAVMTGLYLATYNLGSAVGGAVSGAIWTQVLPGQLRARLSPLDDGAALARAAYADPFAFAAAYPVGTPQRAALIDSYKRAQMLLTVTGLALCVPLVVCALLMVNPRLSDAQTLAKEEEAEGEEEGGQQQQQTEFVAPRVVKGEEQQQQQQQKQTLADESGEKGVNLEVKGGQTLAEEEAPREVVGGGGGGGGAPAQAPAAGGGGGALVPGLVVDYAGIVADDGGYSRFPFRTAGGPGMPSLWVDATGKAFWVGLPDDGDGGRR